MTEQDMKTFKELFGKYCHQEVKNGHCEPDGCEFCPVNKAYEEIFERFVDSEDDLDTKEW